MSFHLESGDGIRPPSLPPAAAAPIDDLRTAPAPTRNEVRPERLTAKPQAPRVEARADTRSGGFRLKRVDEPEAPAPGTKFRLKKEGEDAPPRRLEWER